MAKLYRTPNLNRLAHVPAGGEYDLMRLTTLDITYLKRALTEYNRVYPTNVVPQLLDTLTRDDIPATYTPDPMPTPPSATIPGAIAELDDIVAGHRQEINALRRDRSLHEQAISKLERKYDDLNSRLDTQKQIAKERALKVERLEHRFDNHRHVGVGMQVPATHDLLSCKQYTPPCPECSAEINRLIELIEGR